MREDSAAPAIARAAGLFGFGAVAGSGLDALHTHSGTTAYAAPWWFLMSPWTPLIFGLAGLSVGLSYPLAERWTGRRAGRRLSWAETAAGFAVFAGLYAASAYLPASSGVKLAVLLAGAAGLFAWLARTALALVLAVLTAVVGPLVEALLVHTGFFAYRAPELLGVAMWLPALYACGSLAFGAVGDKVMAKGESSGP
ncbi:MAG TPA: hypothetical protein VGL81_34490 [Polyangiaceae bacterium]|jgi:hypothetical protein